MGKLKGPFRRLGRELSTILCGSEGEAVDRWPTHRLLKRHCALKGNEVSPQSYQFLKVNHVGNEPGVRALIDFVATKYVNEITEILGGQSLDVAQRIERLLEQHTLAVPSPHYKMVDLHAGISLFEWPLLLRFGKKRPYTTLFCHDSKLVEAYADATIADVGKSLLPLDKHTNLVAVESAAEEVMQRSRAEFVAHLKNIWLSVRESISLARNARGEVVGASTVLPLTENAYRRVRRGELSDKAIDPCNDLEIPSRHLFFVGFAEIEPSSRRWWMKMPKGRRVPAVHEHIAELINDGPASDAAVKIIAIAGIPQFANFLEEKGFDRLPVRMPGIEVPLYEIELPSPERSRGEFGTHAETIASTIGLYWRLRANS